MATVVAGVNAVSTTNNTALTTGSFTPAANDLLVAIAHVSGQASGGTFTDSQSLGWTNVLSFLDAASANTMVVAVANNLATNSSMTVTFTPAGSPTSTGVAISVMRVSGMTRTGILAIRQGQVVANHASGTPAPVFGIAPLTGNSCIGAVANATNPATMTAPTAWVTPGEINDIGYGTPATGLETCAVNSGFTSTTVTWGSTSGSAFAAAIIELDTSTPPTQPSGTSTIPKVWLESDQNFNQLFKTGMVPATAANDAIATWTDRSGNNNNFTAGTSPTLQTAVYSGFNTVRAAGASSQFLNGTYTTLPRTVIVCGKCTGSGWNAWSGRKGSGGFYDCMYFIANDSNNIWNNCQITTAAGASVIDLQCNSARRSNQLYIQSYRLTDGTNNVLELFVDGVRTGQSYTTSAYATPTGATLFCDQFAQTNGDFFSGDICAYLEFSSALSDAEITAWWQYLQAKYGSNALGQIGDRLSQPYTASTFYSLPGDSGSDVDEKLYLMGTADGSNFYWFRPAYRNTSAGVRDPSIALRIVGQSTTVLLVHTKQTGFGTTNSNSFHFAQSTDGGRTFNFVKDVAGPNPTCVVWAPEWVRNNDGTLYLDTDGLPHVTFACNLSLNDSSFQFYEVHPTTQDFSGAWSTPVLLSGTSLPANYIDSYCLYEGGTTFRCYFKTEPSGSTGIGYMTSTTSLTSGYTVTVTTITGTANYEGPSVFPFSPTVTRLYMDNNGGGTPGIAYLTSSDGGLTFNTTPTVVSAEGITPRHGTVSLTPAPATTDSLYYAQTFFLNPLTPIGPSGWQ